MIEVKAINLRVFSICKSKSISIEVGRGPVELYIYFFMITHAKKVRQLDYSGLEVSAVLKNQHWNRQNHHTLQFEMGTVVCPFCVIWGFWLIFN